MKTHIIDSIFGSIVGVTNSHCVVTAVVFSTKYYKENPNLFVLLETDSAILTVIIRKYQKVYSNSFSFMRLEKPKYGCNKKKTISTIVGVMS